VDEAYQVDTPARIEQSTEATVWGAILPPHPVYSVRVNIPEITDFKFSKLLNFIFKTDLIKTQMIINCQSVYPYLNQHKSLIFICYWKDVDVTDHSELKIRIQYQW
jgi:hypothetical protein